jgi:hypothetical protein
MRNDTRLLRFAGPSRSPEPHCTGCSRPGKEPSNLSNTQIYPEVTMDSLVVHWATFSPEQRRNPRTTVSLMPICQRRICALSSTSSGLIRETSHPYQLTGPALGVFPLGHQIPYTGPFGLGAHHSFPASSFNASRSKTCWATIFFSLMFSASNSRSRFREAWSIPLYLLRQRWTVASEILY